MRASLSTLARKSKVYSNLSSINPIPTFEYLNFKGNISRTVVSMADSDEHEKLKGKFHVPIAGWGSNLREATKSEVMNATVFLGGGMGFDNLKSLKALLKNLKSFLLNARMPHIFLGDDISSTGSIRPVIYVSKHNCKERLAEINKYYDNHSYYNEESVSLVKVYKELIAKGRPVAEFNYSAAGRESLMREAYISQSFTKEEIVQCQEYMFSLNIGNPLDWDDINDPKVDLPRITIASADDFGTLKPDFVLRLYDSIYDKKLTLISKAGSQYQHSYLFGAGALPLSSNVSFLNSHEVKKLEDHLVKTYGNVEDAKRHFDLFVESSTPHHFADQFKELVKDDQFVDKHIKAMASFSHSLTNYMHAVNTRVSLQERRLMASHYINPCFFNDALTRSGGITKWVEGNVFENQGTLVSR